MTQSEFPESFCKFDKDPRRDKPAHHGNKLPENPMFWPLSQLLHHPGVIEGHIGFPGRRSGGPEKRGQSEGRKKNKQCTDQVNNENMLCGHRLFLGTQNYYNYLSIKILKNQSFVK
jgi:hypothetical protein